MNRILLEAGELDGEGRATLGGARAEHILQVLHGEPGQTLKTGVVGGKAGTGTIERIEGGEVTLRCEHGEETAGPWADLLMAPPRPRVMKRLLPQLAALGVGKIVLTGAEKVEKSFWSARLLLEEVYRPLLVDGLMQAGTTALPELKVERNFRRWVNGGGVEREFAGCGERIVAHPYGAVEIREKARERGPGRILLAVGPEGGWTEEEVEMLEARGFWRMGLGPRILRSDTATVALLAQLMAFGG